MLTAYDPTAAVEGFPYRPEFADAQGRLLASIKHRYQAQVTELLREVTELEEHIE